MLQEPDWLHAWGVDTAHMIEEAQKRTSFS